MSPEPQSTTPETSAANAAREAAAAPAQLVVRSIGTASFSIIAALRQISTLTEQELAERLFRAPSELFRGVPRQTAEKAAEQQAGPCGTSVGTPSTSAAATAATPDDASPGTPK